ncbi:cupredoxin domain-containing protein [Streptomyces sp. NPDC002055]|uniref:cupredoxin domain-containing protein n=1 Tax=Streptomyces sp. NPDC002055 TaxID=3154534 RepID=UPI003322EC64
MTRIVTVRRSVGAGIGAGVLAGVLAACGGGGYGGGSGGDGNGSTTSPPKNSGTTRVAVTMTDYHFRLNPDTFHAGAYTFVATNDGHHPHAMELKGPGGEQRSATVGPGQSTTLKVTLKDGTYQVFCPVDNHTDLGMKTTITVSGTGTSDGNTTGGNNGY